MLYERRLSFMLIQNMPDIFLSFIYPSICPGVYAVYLSLHLPFSLAFFCAYYLYVSWSLSISLTLFKCINIHKYIYYDIYNAFHTQCSIQPYSVCLKSNRLCIITDFALLQCSLHISSMKISQLFILKSL